MLDTRRVTIDKPKFGPNLQFRLQFSENGPVMLKIGDKYLGQFEAKDATMPNFLLVEPSDVLSVAELQRICKSDLQDINELKLEKVIFRDITVVSKCINLEKLIIEDEFV